MRDGMIDIWGGTQKISDGKITITDRQSHSKENGRSLSSSDHLDHERPCGYAFIVAFPLQHKRH